MHKPLEASKPTRDSPDTASRLLTTMASPLGARWFWDDARVVLEVGGNGSPLALDILAPAHSSSQAFISTLTSEPYHPAHRLLLPSSSSTPSPFSIGRRIRARTAPRTLAHAMSRDGSSGGTIRMAVITKEGVERFFVPGDQLPKLEDTV
ncbi:hypothetical protein RTBOTA2_002260 [Rhodotorula toruloides]|nr:hypothetical protein RTBOTA2_002260 [Rhodotorula toruloides]